MLLSLACVFGLFMAWGIGANDVANAMGTSVGARALTLKQAILVAAIFEFLGAYLAGGEVTSTIRKGIVDPSLLGDSPQLLVYGMLASLLAAATWLAIASSRGWPGIYDALHCRCDRRVFSRGHLCRCSSVEQSWHHRGKLGCVTFDVWHHRFSPLCFREEAYS